MAIEEKTYLLCNYSSSKIVVALRDSSVVIEGGHIDSPTTYPFTAGELQLINNTSTSIKNGLLMPVDSEKEFVYESLLRIMDWRNIKTNKEIEDLILNPTPEDLNWIVSIKDSQYFNRIYGIFIGLKNTTAPLMANVSNIICARYKEIVNGKRETEIVIPENVVSKSKSDAEESARIKNLEAEVAELRRLLKSSADTESKSEDNNTSDTKNISESKPVNKKTTKTRGNK